MQLALDMGGGGRSNPVLVVDYLLRKSIDLQPVTYRFEPVTQLVKAILGKRTPGDVSVKALSDLRRSYKDWSLICNSKPEDILEIIRPVTHSDRKAGELIDCFRQIRRECGTLDLSHLEHLSVPQALRWLECLPGVGRKVSASVLNTSDLHRRALVIDTHHLRILKRLGLVGAKQDYHAAYDLIMPQLPPSWCATRIDDHHRRFKRLGQSTCQHWRPDCRSCPLRGICPTAS